MTENFTKEEINEMLKGFVAKALSMEEVDSYIVIATDKRGVKIHSIGSELEIYGLLDYVKRKKFVDMADRSDLKKHNGVTRAEFMEDIRTIIREEMKHENIVGRETP